MVRFYPEDNCGFYSEHIPNGGGGDIQIGKRRSYDFKQIQTEGIEPVPEKRINYWKNLQELHGLVKDKDLVMPGFTATRRLKVPKLPPAGGFRFIKVTQCGPNGILDKPMPKSLAEVQGKGAKGTDGKGKKEKKGKGKGKGKKGKGKKGKGKKGKGKGKGKKK